MAKLLSKVPYDFGSLPLLLFDDLFRFEKELILRRDARLHPILAKFEAKEAGDSSFLEQIHELIRDEAQLLYDDLFRDTSLEVGKTLSKEERDRKNLTQEKSLIYGEVEFNSFYRVLRKINAEPGTIFYDLGSGTGKAVFAARLTQDFSKCIGIEILQSLHQQATAIVKRYNSDFKDQLSLGQVQGAAVYEVNPNINFLIEKVRHILTDLSVFSSIGFISGL